MQPQIHLVDETWLAVEPNRVVAEVTDPANWARWWPPLTLRVTRDRGLKGMQWAAVSRPVSSSKLTGWRHRPALAGTVEIWLEPMLGGVLLHHYLRLDPVGDRRLGRRAADRVTRRFAWQAKRQFWQLKDRLEAGR